MKFFQKKCVNLGLLLAITLPILVGQGISLAQSNTTDQIEESNPVFDNSYFKIDNRNFSVELGDKKTDNDNVVSFKAFPEKESGNGWLKQLSDSITKQQKGLSFELIKATDQSNIETEIDQLNLEYSRENDQTGVAAQVGNFFSGLMDQFWNNIDGIANIGRKTNDLIWEENDNTSTVVNPILDKDISLEYQALENGLKENILVKMKLNIL